MLYSNYEKKIERIEKILRRIYKFRVLIISIIGLILIASAFLLYIKGTFYEDLKIHNSQIYYGDEYAYSAKAYMSNVEYEFYNNETQQWQAKKPKKAGEYKIRAKTRRIFGSTYYSDEVTFVIMPVETTVTPIEETLVYGQYPTPKIDLIYEDIIANYTYKFDSVNVGEQNVEIDSVCIKNTNGEDVSFCYNFSFQSKTIEIVQKEAKIKFEGDEKVYDGTPLFNDKYSIEGLEYGDEVVILECPQIINAGEISNDVDFTIVNKNGVSVKDNYKITVEAENLCVTKRSISVKPKPESQIYNAQPLKAKECELAFGEMIEGHYFDSSIFGGEIVDCGEGSSFIVSTTILDVNRNDVTSNYEIEYLEGALEITPCKITVFANAKKTYDASSNVESARLSYCEAIISRYDGAEGLFGGHEMAFELITNPNAINVGKYPIQIEEYPTITVGGRDVTFNFDIKLLIGTLEITPCELSIKPKASKTYDGTNSIEDVNVALDIERDDGGKALFGNQHVEYELIFANEADAGSYTLKIKEYPKIMQGNIDLTSNYKITLLDGTLEIKQRKICLITGGDEKEYDGTALSCSDYREEGDGLVETHELKIYSTPSITKVGEIENYYDVDVLDKDGHSIARNYIIEQSPGKLIIKKRKMNIELYDVHKVYDGSSANIDDRYWYTKNNLLGGDSIVGLTNFTVENANGEQVEIGNIISSGTYKVKAECLINYGTDYVGYYDIEVIGYIIIEKAEIILLSNSASKTYDGEELVDDGYEIAYGEIALIDEISVYNVGYQIAVGESKNTIAEIKINDNTIRIGSEGVYEFSDYKITVKFGTLTVTNN